MDWNFYTNPSTIEQAISTARWLLIAIILIVIVQGIFLRARKRRRDRIAANRWREATTVEVAGWKKGYPAQSAEGLDAQAENSIPPSAEPAPHFSADAFAKEQAAHVARIEEVEREIREGMDMLPLRDVLHVSTDPRVRHYEEMRDRAAEIRREELKARRRDLIGGYASADYHALDLDQRMRAAAACEHEWTDMKNDRIESGEICLKCGSVRPAKPPEPVVGQSGFRGG